jgi:hypothetical protein
MLGNNKSKPKFEEADNHNRSKKEKENCDHNSLLGSTPIYCFLVQHIFS